MKKLLFFIFLLNTLYADYLYTPDNYCALSWSDARGNLCEIDKSNGDTVYVSGACDDNDFVDGYTYDADNDDCYIASSDDDAETLGLTKNEYNFLMGLTANFLGFTMIFLVGFLFVLQGRR